MAEGEVHGVDGAVGQDVMPSRMKSGCPESPISDGTEMPIPYLRFASTVGFSGLVVARCELGYAVSSEEHTEEPCGNAGGATNVRRRNRPVRTSKHD